MTTEIYIISGFLGAGKTTFIQKLLNEAFHKEKVVIIENDFGEISVDAALLKSGGIEVKEINSGCICCSLSGDFVKALKELLDRFQPDKIIIEPSGVGKLSDIMKACLDPRVLPLAKVKAKITVVDVKRCKMYLDNFGEFFEDQIQNADIVLLSRTENFSDKVDDAYKLIKSMNSNSAIFIEPWDKINVEDILYPEHKHHVHGEHCDHAHSCICGHHAAHGEQHCHEHGNDCDCDHNHSAEDVFDTITIRTERVFSIKDLKEQVLNMELNAKGTILRAKGIVHGPNGYLNMQYLPGDTRITNCDTSGNMLCIIGSGLDRQELAGFFSEE